MGLVGGLLLMLIVLGNMAAGMTTLYLHMSVVSILTARHPELWRDMDGYSIAARQTFARFLCGGAALRMNDPGLARAVVRVWIGMGLWLAIIVASAVTASVLDTASR